MVRLARSVAVIGLVILSSNWAFADEEKYKIPNFSLGMNFQLLTIETVPHNFGTTGNIPLRFRQIPSHPDDTWIYQNPVIKTISSDSVKPGALFYFGNRIGPEVAVYRLKFRSGINVIIPLAPKLMPDANSTREVNQFGTSVRGEGTSLVYYGIEARGTKKPGFYYEAEVHISKKFSLLAGYGKENYNVFLQNGYDRWNKFSKYRNYHLSSNQIEKRYLGLNWWPDRGEDDFGDFGDLFVNIGKVSTLVSPSQEAGDLPVNYGANWFMSFGSSLHLAFLKSK